MKTIVSVILGLLTGLVPVVNIRYLISHFDTPEPTAYDYGVVIGIVLETAAIIVAAMVYLF